MGFLVLRVPTEFCDVRVVKGHIHLYARLQALIGEAGAVFGFDEVHVWENLLAHVYRSERWTWLQRHSSSCFCSCRELHSMFQIQLGQARDRFAWRKYSPLMSWSACPSLNAQRWEVGERAFVYILVNLRSNTSTFSSICKAVFPFPWRLVFIWLRWLVISTIKCSFSIQLGSSSCGWKSRTDAGDRWWWLG